MKILLLLLFLSCAFSRPDWFSNLNRAHQRLAQRLEQQIDRQVNTALGNLRQTLNRFPRPQPLVEKLDPDVEILDPEDLRPDSDEEKIQPGIESPEFTGGSDYPVVIDPFGSNIFNGFNGFEIFKRRNWWKGPNVCVSREEDEEILNTTSVFPFHAMLEFTHCQDLGHRYVCESKKGQDGVQRTVKAIYECCYGYSRKQGAYGCEQAEPMVDLFGTLAELGEDEFLYLINTFDMEDKLKHENLTVFVPTDDAVLEYMQGSQIQYNIIPELKRKKREESSLPNIVLNHMTKGFHLEGSIKDEQILSSETEDGTIRINKYGRSPLGGKLITSNCARITDSDNMATNGVVHTIAQVMKPVTKTIAQIITTEPQFSILATLLKKADMLGSLERNGSYTLFAPTDYAFKSDPSLLNKLTKGKGCLENVLKNHVLKHVICSVAIQSTVYIHNLHKTSVELKRDEDDYVSVNGVKLQEKDLLGTNGVIHSINGVLMPESARTLSQALLDANLTEFHSFLKDHDLLDTLDDMENFTVLAPTNEAIKMMPKHVKDMFKDEGNKIADMLMYHVSNPGMSCGQIDNNMMLSSGLINRNIRINTYKQHNLFNRMSHRVTANCAPLHMIDHRTCSGRVHLLNRVIIPPTNTIMDFLSSHKNFTRMAALLQDSGLAERLVDDGPFTVLAVPDHVFESLPEEKLSSILNDKEKAKEIAHLHVIPEMLCCHGVGRDLLFGNVRYQTIGGGRLPIRRSDSGYIRAGPATVTQCDYTATNGVVHEVNSLIMPDKLRRENPFHRIRLPGLFEIQFHTV